MTTSATSAKPQRNSNFELLRLVAMFLVLGVHANFLALGRVTPEELAVEPLEGFTRTFLNAICLVCVDVFVLISGWFGLRPNLRKVLSFIFIVVFWRWAIALFMLCAGRAELNSEFLRSLIPGYKEWFPAAYGLLMLIAPMVNAYIDSRPRAEVTRYTAVYLCVTLIFGFIVPVDLWGMSFYGGYSLLGVLTMYLIGRLMRLYADRLEAVAAWKWVAGFFGLALLNSAAYCSLTGLTGFTPYHQFQNYLSPLTVLQSVCLFMIFSKFRFKSRMINSAALGVFAIYLIHCNSYIMGGLMNFIRAIYESWPPLAALGLIVLELVAVMVGCLLADRLRLMAWRIIDKKLIPTR